jgi:hypothetical protein
MSDPNEVEWLLSRIDSLHNPLRPKMKATHRNIWAGSYDVWFCEQDRIDAVEIPKRRMQEALDAGFIVGAEELLGKYKATVYHLTDMGREHMRQCAFERERACKNTL